MKCAPLKLVVINFKREFNCVLESQCSTLSRIQMDSNARVIIILPKMEAVKKQLDQIKLA